MPSSPLSQHAASAPQSTPLPLWKVWLPPVLILAATLLLAAWSYRSHQEEHRLQFLQQAGKIAGELRTAMRDYKALLHGGAGMLSVTPQPSRAQWEQYVGTLGHTRLRKGTRGLGFSRHASAAELPALLRSMPGRGLPGFRLWPAGQRDEYCPLILVAPTDARNAGVSGFDLYTSPERRAAMQRARDTGQAAMSTRVLLAGEPQDTPRPGCVLFVPVYAKGQPTSTEEERRKALTGYVTCPFRMDDLLQATLGESLGDTGLLVYDGEDEPAPGTFMYATQPQEAAPDFRTRSVVNIAGHSWTLVHQGWMPGGAGAAPRELPVILLAGLLLAGAVYFIIRNIDATRDKAERMARQMTADLRQSEDYNRAVFQHSSLPMGVSGLDGAILEANAALLELLGYSREELQGLRWNDLTHPDDREQSTGLLREALEDGRDGYQTEKRYVRKDGRAVWVLLNVGIMRGEDGQPGFFIGTAKDITGHKAEEESERLRQLRRTALLRLHEMHLAPRQELLDFALEQVLLLTDSPLGYIFGYDDSRRRFSLDALSPAARELCSVLEQPEIYSLEQAGIWGEAVRQRQPVMLNDFSQPNPALRGLPEGHIPLTRFLTVPIISSGRVLAVVGVANREAPYAEADVHQLRLFTDGLGAVLEHQAAEQELRAMTERFHLAVRAGRIGLWDWDLASGAMHCDAFMEELFGLDDNNRFGTPEDWLCRVHPEDRERVRQTLDEGARAGGRFSASFRVQRADGSSTFIEASTVSHLDRQGQPLRLVGVNIDATRLRQAEQELAATNRFLQTLIDTLPHTFFCKDTQGRYLLVNQAFADMRGLPSPAEFLGHSVREYDPPELADLHEAWDRKLLEAGPGASVSYEHDRLNPAGVLEHRILFKHLLPMPDGSLAIVGLNIDISDRKAAEEALREERRRLTDVIEGTNAGTWEWNIKTGETVYNQRWAEILGYSLEELAPISVKTWERLTHPDDLANAKAVLQRHFEGNAPFYDCECRMRHKDGRWVWVHDRGRVFRHAKDGGPLLMSGTHSDISERKLAEDRLSLVARFPVESPNPILRVDGDGSLLYANPAAAGLLADWGQEVGGMLPAELSGEVRLSLGSAQARTAERSYASGVYSITVAPFLDKGYANIYAVDVTLRKAAELALGQSERRNRELATLLRLMCDNVPDMIWAKDLENRYLFANRAVCEQFLGTSDTQAPLGRTDQHFAQQHQNANPAEPSWTTIYEACVVSDLETLRGDGRGHYEESGVFQGQVRHFDVCKAPFYNDQGALIGTVGSARDITERKNAEDALTRSEERFRTLAQVSPVGIFQADPLGRCIYVNDQWARITGYPKEAALGLRWMLTLEPQDRKAALRGFRETVHSGSDFMAEFRLRAADGPGKWVLVRGAAERNAQGAFIGIVGALTDISGLKAAEQALRRAKAEAEEATRTKAQFLANMSHEIRTPLAGVIGTTRLLAQTELDQEQQRLAEMAVESGQALLSVVNDILDFSKIEAGHMALRPAPFGLRRFLTSVAAPSQALAQAHGLEFRLAVDQDVPDELVGDEGRLGQVLRNLLSNALKFTERGAISLGVSVESLTPTLARLRLAVADTGPGIAPDYLPRLFESFSQGDSSYAKQHGGTGLGLAICRSLIEQMGGRVEVQSALGAGSTFTVHAPFRLADVPTRKNGKTLAAEAKAAYPAPVPAAAPRAAALRVLLADDNDIGRMLTGHALQKAGHHFTGVADGEAVLLALRQNVGQDRFDLVLMDVQMPRLDGLAATRAIRQGQAGAQNAAMAVVGLTAYAAAEDRQRCLEAGMDGVVTKPAEEAPLFEAMSRALAEARRRGAPSPENAPSGPADTAAARPAAPASGSPGAPDALPPRLDQDYLQRAFHDEQALLEVMLTQFQAQSLPELRRELDLCLKAGDLQIGLGLAHKARGTLGSVGAGRGAHLAGQAEKAAAKGDADGFSRLAAALLQELAALAEHLDQKLPWGPQA